MPKPQPHPKPLEYHIAFETKGHGGYIKSVKVTLEADILDMDGTYRIDLADHPLYKSLQAYVLGNPR